MDSSNSSNLVKIHSDGNKFQNSKTPPVPFLPKYGSNSLLGVSHCSMYLATGVMGVFTSCCRRPISLPFQT